MFSFFSKTISLKSIQKAKYLDKAIEKDISYFLDCRLHNPPRKAMVGLWLIFFEDANYIYWGKPRFRRLFSDDRVVDEFYKTDKKAVLESYPQYSIDFFSLQIRDKIREAVQQHEGLKDGILFRSFATDYNYKINIEEGLFNIKASGELCYTAAPYSDNAREEKVNKTYKLKLKIDDLAILEITEG